MDNKYLWSIIDVLREELSSGTEYGKLQAEIKSLEKLIEAKHKKRNEDSNLIAELKLAIVDQNDDIKTLKSNQDKLKLVIENQEDEIKELKAENCGLINESKWDKNKLIKELQAENDSLKDEAVKWNRKYNKACYKIEYPKDYLKEAKEHFHHNPNCKGVRFHMIDFDEYDYDNNDGLNGLSGEYNGSLMAEDCLLEIDNEGSKPTFH